MNARNERYCGDGYQSRYGIKDIATEGKSNMRMNISVEMNSPLSTYLLNKSHLDAMIWI